MHMYEGEAITQKKAFAQKSAMGFLYHFLHLIGPKKCFALK